MATRQTTQWSKDRQHNGQKTDNTMVKRQTTQWPKDGQHNGQKTDNTMAKRQTPQWPKDRHHNGQKKKYNRTNNNLQNIHIKLKINDTNPSKIQG